MNANGISQSKCEFSSCCPENTKRKCLIIIFYLYFGYCDAKPCDNKLIYIINVSFIYNIKFFEGIGKIFKALIASDMTGFAYVLVNSFYNFIY